MAHFLITGGAGFVGSHLATLLLSEGHRLTLVDDLSTGRSSNVERLLAGDNCRLVNGRVSDVLENDAHLLDDVDAIYHLAASVGVRLVVNDPMAMLRNNLNQAEAVLEAAADRNILTLITSSSEVYGKNPNVPLAESHDLLFGPTTAPRWSYALAKALDEHMALALHKHRDLPVVIVRLFNTIGPRQVGNYGMVVPRFVAAAVAGEPLEIHGDGKQSRAFCDVRDVVRALATLMGRSESIGQVFNVGSSEECTVEQLADLVIDVAGSGSKNFVPYEQVFGKTFEDMRRRIPDLTKIETAIGFKRAYSLRDTVTDLVDAARRQA